MKKTPEQTVAAIVAKSAPAGQSLVQCPIHKCNTVYYDGALGYESFICPVCRWDINDPPPKAQNIPIKFHPQTPGGDDIEKLREQSEAGVEGMLHLAEKNKVLRTRIAKLEMGLYGIQDYAKLMKGTDAERIKYLASQALENI